jgi:tetratricopeptide (TPR) repeat protein
LANLRQDHEGAADRYFEGLRRAPGDETLLDGAASASLASGDIEGASRAARLAGAGDGQPASIELIRAAEALASGRARQAGVALDRVEGRAAQNLAAAMMRSWVRAADGRVDDVVATLQPLATVRPYGALFSYQQAMALDFAGRGDEALAAYASAAGGGVTLPPAIERHADLLVRRGDTAGAVALLGEETNRANAVLAATRRRIEQGESLGFSPLTPARGAAAGLYGLSMLFMQENDTASALETLTVSLMLDPQLDAARLLFAQTQSERDRPDAARRMLSQIGATSPYAPSARVMEAWVLFDEGRKEEALALVEAAASGGDLRAGRALADMYRSLQRFDAAEAVYTRLIEQQPNEWRLYFARGAARAYLDHWPQAEADLQHALDLFPEQPDVMNFLAYSWVERGEHLDEALVMLRRAVALRPSSGAIVDSLGWAHYRLGEYPEALTYIERAVELSPSHATLNDHLGDVYWRLGRRIEARFQWQRALSLEPEDAEAIQAKLENGLPDAPPTLSARR